MSDAVAVVVDCYARHRGEETPRRVTRGDQRVEILAVLDQWRTPDHRYFRVRTADETYMLRQDVRSGGWELTEVGRRAPRYLRAPPRHNPVGFTDRATLQVLRYSRSRVPRVL